MYTFWQIPVTTQRHPYTNFDKSIQQLRKTFFQFWQIHVTTLTVEFEQNSTRAVTLLTEWQGKAMIGLGFDENLSKEV